MEERKKAKTKIGNNANNNLVLQNSTVYQTNIINGGVDTFACLSAMEQYEDIQEIFSQQMDVLNCSHPLREYFSVKPYSVGDFSRLISSPKTAEALEKYPKIIKTTFEFSKSKYPNMGADETPWAYAYRTQTPIKVSATAYKEYLGDQEDPFPLTTYSDGMKVVIGPQPFPAAQKVILSAGKESIEIMLRRQPSLPVNELHFASESSNAGIAVLITQTISPEHKATINFTKLSIATVEEHLKRERFIHSLATSKKVEATMDGEMFFSSTIEDEELSKPFFTTSGDQIKFFSNLQSLQKHFDCQFAFNVKNVQEEDYILSFVLAASIKNSCFNFNTAFDSVRVPYNKINEAIFENHKEANGCILMETPSGTLNYFGLNFSFSKIVIQFANAKINNATSVQKNIKRKKDDILITIKPKDVTIKYIEKYQQIFDLKLVD